jgi:hypothetical protein
MPGIVRSNAKNPLNAYRSYNYIFTLASLKSRALEDPSTYTVNQDYFVIAKSGGKGSSGMQTPTDLGAPPQQGTPVTSANPDTGLMQPQDVQALVDGFNAQSPGRFDFFIDNVHLETLIGGGEVTSMSIATKIEFDVFEPYSMTGFIEALQVSAVAAGHDSYINCPYLLKMEFIGYKDSDDLVDAERVPNSTRFFVMGFTGLDIDVTESGARYRCKCVPFNEKAMGSPAILDHDIKTSGSSVGEILINFIDGVNQTIQSDIGTEGNSEDRNKYDTYEIVFPTRSDTGIDPEYLTNKDGYNKNKIANATVAELLKSNSVYAFPNPESEQGEVVRLDPTKPVIQFAKSADIYDCITSIIRDSSYTKEILNNFASRIDPNTGMVKYFMVHAEITKRGIFDKKRNHDCLHYRYVVIEYDLHYTRIQPRPADVVDTSNIKQAVLREYNYFYTGQNVDIRNFNLKFNTLFFQAIPRAMGNKPSMPATENSLQSTDPSKASMPEGSPNNSAMGNAPVTASALRSTPIQSGNQNATFPQVDPYADLAKGMHQAILENVDQCQAELQIVGDPFYLVTNGVGNQKLVTNPDGSAGEGEANAYMGDIHILIMFRNPIDIDADTGFAYFDNRSALYSGVFRVISLKSEFRNGEFLQTLQLIRMPYQLEDTNQEPTKKPISLVGSVPDPLKASTPTPTPPVSTVTPSADNLISQIAAGLPLTGLPNQLSNLIPGNLGGLAGSFPGRTAIGSLVNSVASLAAGATSALGSFISQGSGPISQGLTNVSSALRLTNSGLSTFSTNINSAGGSVNQLAATANSVGLSKITPTNLGSSLLATGNGTVETLGKSAIAAVGSLGQSAAGLVSQAASKLDGINGQDAALAAQLGITPSSLAGLSPNLQASIVNQISSAAKSLPSDVNLGAAIDKGLIFNNIPTANLPNIPATQPDATAPAPAFNLKDIKYIVDRGGKLDNLPGASLIPGVTDLLKNQPVPSLVKNSTLGAASLADKAVTLQAGLGKLTNSAPSIEASLNNISSFVPSGVPNVSSVASSVVSKYGSASNAAFSPLKTLIQSNLSG